MIAEITFAADRDTENKYIPLPLIWYIGALNESIDYYLRLCCPVSFFFIFLFLVFRDDRRPAQTKEEKVLQWCKDVLFSNLERQSKLTLNGSRPIVMLNYQLFRYHKGRKRFSRW